MEHQQQIAFNQRLIDEYRANAGRLSGPITGERLLLLTTTGARTGRPRTAPMGFTRLGDDLVVIAADAGAPHHPAWYHNLLANPDATVELGGERFGVRARILAGGDERDRLVERQRPQMEYFDAQQEKTSRVIPLVILERV